LSAARILAIYRVTFVTLLIIASVQTLSADRAAHHDATALAASEIGGALALLWPYTRVLGACLLLAVFALAQVASTHAGQWPTHLAQYAASTLLIVTMSRALPPGTPQARACRRSPRSAASTASSKIPNAPPPP
jgi:hypothetical protein